ncbi:MAG: hypothetical protein ACI8Z1_000290 [Candidatus Azotimanducaceae bacterium]|jgi:hypothetical protein
MRDESATMKKPEFEKDARDILNDHVDGLDGATLSKLHRLRFKAVANQLGHKIWFPLRACLGAGALAASIAVAVLFIDRQPSPLPAIYGDPSQQAAAENLELMDDLEFIAWLVLEEDLANETTRSGADKT